MESDEMNEKINIETDPREDVFVEILKNGRIC